ncbi:trypsin-like [Leptidea sinapis]|uniref:trypsin-like n=1 Tax=Leptidea sinapis TaxID=189913 RepID=UPI002141788B|nr:trypsin-like [Leptidea sinapis]
MLQTMEGVKHLIYFFGLLLFQDVYCNTVSFLEDGKIVGGYKTTISQYPYQVLVLMQVDKQMYQCGGSIISKQVILTAAHCLYQIDKAFVRAGLTNQGEKQPFMGVKNFTCHPNYNPNTTDYDVGLIELTEPLVLDGFTKKTIRLTKSGTQIPPGTKLTLTGWGTTSEGGAVSDNLETVEVSMTSDTECRKVYGDTVTERMFCAGVPDGGKDSCQGDSGGPVVLSSSKIQVGIVSHGYGCARPGVPGVYTNVASPGIRDWIQRLTGI